MVAIPVEKKGNRDPLASRSLAAFARYVGHPKSDHPRRLGARTHGSQPRRVRTADMRDTKNFTCDQQTLKWSSREQYNLLNAWLAFCVSICWVEQTLQGIVTCQSHREW